MWLQVVGLSAVGTILVIHFAQVHGMMADLRVALIHSYRKKFVGVNTARPLEEGHIRRQT